MPDARLKPIWCACSATLALFLAGCSATVLKAAGLVVQLPAGEAVSDAPQSSATAKQHQSEQRDPAASVLYLNDGDFFTGTLCDCPTANTIRWLSKGAIRPFEFDGNWVRSASFTVPKNQPAPVGDYCIELTQGDLLYGTLAALDKNYIELESPSLGRLRIARAEISRITAGTSAAFVYRGPNGLADWTSDHIDQWHDEAGRVATEKRGAAIKRSIAIPKQAQIEFEISWTKSPQFAMAFCSSDKEAQIKEGYRLEVWGRKLVLVRELAKTADVAFVSTLDAHADRIHLTALYNFPTGEFSIQSLEGVELARVKLAKTGGYPLRLVWLKNMGPGIALEQLAVSNWNGKAPPLVDVKKSRIHKVDGSVVYGDVVAYDPAKKQFTIQTGGKDSQIDNRQVACIVPAPVSHSGESRFRITLHDGSRFCGDVSKVEAGKIYLQRSGIDRPIASAIENVRAIVGLKRVLPAVSYTKARIGHLVSTGVSSYGALIESSKCSESGASCLEWKPQRSNLSSPLRAELSGRIVYRERSKQPKESDSSNQEEPQPQRRVGVFWGAVSRVFDGVAPAPSTAVTAHSTNIRLLSGDRIPCDTVQIDEDGIHFTSPIVTAAFIPHSSVKAVEFTPNWTSAALAEVKRTRLLTLPRMQKNNPPTHMIASTAGDFLRCRLTTMDSKWLNVEARLEPKKIPRERVACIIWLHDSKEAKDSQDAKSSKKASSDGLLVQAVESDGVRLTFVPRDCDGSLLSGTSDVLGSCNVRLSGVDELILGSRIAKETEEQTYDSWKLRDAAEPEFAKDSPASGSGGTMVDSILVGKPAPDIQLELLSGEHFQLSTQKGSVVVLDFWASWCGPCMQSMPLVDKVMEEYKDKGVKLFAINMQEDKATASGAIERLKIHPAVALDVDGAAAERYQVTAIPQLVVIDKENKVAQLMIGGDSAELRAALDKVLAPPAKTTPK